MANTLIFPNLSSGNIAYKLVKEMSQFEAIGPVLLGMKRPVHVLQIGSSVREILNMITLGVIDVQTENKMIAHIEDILESKLPNQVIIDVNGIGYLLHISLNTFEDLPSKGN